MLAGDVRWNAYICATGTAPAPGGDLRVVVFTSPGGHTPALAVRAPIDEHGDMTVRDMPFRLEKALNARDLDAIVDCFTDDYDCVIPLQPARNFRGNAQVRANWTALFDRLPEFHARLLGHVVDGDSVWTDWEMRGTPADGTVEEMGGVAIFRVVDGRAAGARFYLAPVVV
jgi:hypothetical protein